MKTVRIDAKLIFSICILLISIVYLYASKDLALGTMKRPGVGFLPLIAGTLAAFFTLLDIIRSYLNNKDFKKINFKWNKIAVFFFGVILYAMMLKPIGYEIATFGAMFFLAKLFGAKSWLKPLIFSVLLSWGSYYLFAELLLVPLP